MVGADIGQRTSGKRKGVANERSDKQIGRLCFRTNHDVHNYQSDGKERVMKCWGCEYFKIIQEPLRVGKDIYDLGRAECTNFDLVVDFINHGKLKRLECIDETMGEREGE